MYQCREYHGGKKNADHSLTSSTIPHNLPIRVFWKDINPANRICTPDSKVHGANMGPIWGRQDPGGPHGGPMNLALWDSSSCSKQFDSCYSCLCLSAHLSAHVSVCHNFFYLIPMSHHHWTCISGNANCMYDFRSKVKVTQIVQSYWCICSMAPYLFDYCSKIFERIAIYFPRTIGMIYSFRISIQIYMIWSTGICNSRYILFVSATTIYLK